jgi:hypothetical protein
VTDKTPDKTGPSVFCARLQTLHLTHDTYVLVFDQWDGPALPDDHTRRIKTETGAKAVLFFRGTIDIGC